jgi:hypothetical protein
MGINYAELVRPLLSEKPEVRARGEALIQDCFEAKEIRPSDFDFGQLFAETFGVNHWMRGRSDNRYMVTKDVFENAGAVATNAFQNISGQIVYNAIMDAYNLEELVFKKAIPVVQTPFKSEKIAGITNIGDEAQLVNEGDEFPLVGVSEDYIETPETKKRGYRIAVTREAIFFDRTNVILDRCSKLGEFLGINNEKRAIDALIDGNTTAHRHKWRDSVYATYQLTTPWINKKAANPLVDWTSFQAAEQLLDQMTDPNTGEPFVVQPSDVIVPKPLVHQLNQILRATENRYSVGGYATSGNLNTRIAPNTVAQYTPYTSRYVRARLSAASMDTSSWFLGNIKEAVCYMQNFPMQVIPAPPNSHDEFHRDIVQQWRADERGAYFVKQPRLLVWNVTS